MRARGLSYGIGAGVLAVACNGILGIGSDYHLVGDASSNGCGQGCKDAGTGGTSDASVGGNGQTGGASTATGGNGGASNGGKNSGGTPQNGGAGGVISSGGSGGGAGGTGGALTGGGGNVSTGGAPSTGGVQSTGGANAGGATGGSPATGGAPSTGGAPASGGGPGDCCSGKGNCGPRPTSTIVWNQDTCASNKVCLPVVSGSFTKCAAICGVEGRCMPQCTWSSSLPWFTQDVCPGGELCVPCYDPCRGIETGACSLAPGDAPTQAYQSCPDACG